MVTRCRPIYSRLLVLFGREEIHKLLKFCDKAPVPLPSPVPFSKVVDPQKHVKSGTGADKNTGKGCKRPW